MLVVVVIIIYNMLNNKSWRFIALVPEQGTAFAFMFSIVIAIL